MCPRLLKNAREVLSFDRSGYPKLQKSVDERWQGLIDAEPLNENREGKG
jgi:hypothetical protein